MSLLQESARVESLTVLSRFRTGLYDCLPARRDALFELTDAVLSTDGPVRALVDLTLVAEHRRGHGAMYDALNRGRLEPDRRAKSTSQFISGWPYSFVATLETGRTSWTAVLDAVSLGPADDATAVTADQLRGVVGRLIDAGHWTEGDADILIVMDAGYDVTRLAFVLDDLPIELVGRLPSDRVLHLPAPERLAGTNGRPPKHRPAFALAKPATWPTPDQSTVTDPTRYGKAQASAWVRLHPRLTHRGPWLDHDVELPLLHAR
jgi:hypothetical protein